MPLFWLSLAFLLGILLGSWYTMPAIIWLIFAGSTLLLFPANRYTINIRQTITHRLNWTFPRLTNSIKMMAMRISQLFSVEHPAFSIPPLPLLLCFLCLGAARFQFSQPSITPEYIAWYNGQDVKMFVKGRLIAPPDDRDQFTYLRIKVEWLHAENDLHYQPVHGLLLARVDPGGSWRYGDQVRLEGYLEVPFSNEAFSFRDYLARQDIYSIMDNAHGIILLHNQGSPVLSAIYNLRQTALERIYIFFPDPEASLLAGILLGVRTGISQQVDLAFRLTGTSHVIAISGFNITILAGLFTFLFRRLLGRTRGMMITVVVVIIYTIMVGASAAVVRASILAVLGLFGHEVGRRQTGLNSLAIVAAGMSLFQPGVLWDVGFQLSFAATLGLILYADPFVDAFSRLAGRVISSDLVNRLSGPVGAYILFTLAAQLTTLPLIIHYTGDLSLSALLANPLILPAQPPLMILGGVATLVGLISIPFGQLLAYFTWPFLAFTIRTVEWLANMPGGVLHLGNLGVLSVLLYYIVLFGWTLSSWIKAQQASQEPDDYSNLQTVENPGVVVHTKHYLQTHPWLPFLILVLLVTITWRDVLSASNGKLQVSILNVGSSEAILIHTPTGRNLMINGGPSGMELADALGRRLPPGHRQFDWWVIANRDDDAIAALTAILDRYPPEHVLWAGPTHSTYISRQLWQALTDANRFVTSAETGQVLELDGSGSLQVLEAGKRGATLLLNYRNFNLLLPVGINFESIEQLQSQVQPVSALLLADSGYAPLNPDDWLNRLDPQLVLISVAADDPQGLPDHETLESLEGYTILRTDSNGWIELTTDGEQLWVEVEKK